jgi:integrase
MKKHKLTSTQNLHLASPRGSTPLEQVVSEFLRDKALFCGRAHLSHLRYSLRELAANVGRRPILGVTTTDVCQAVFQPRLHPWTQKQILDSIKGLFNWGCKQDYLSRSPASGLHVLVFRNTPTILTPDQLKTLLAAANDCECRLYLAISAFTGIRPAELARLSWQDITPATELFIPAQAAMCKRRARKIARVPALDAWLEPFYGSQGPVINIRSARRKLNAVARSLGILLKPHALRNSHYAYRLALEHDFVRVAAELGCSFQLSHKPLLQMASLTQAKEFFSLTPAAVGLRDWSEIVAARLKTSKAAHTVRNWRTVLSNQAASISR